MSQDARIKEADADADADAEEMTSQQAPLQMLIDQASPRALYEHHRCLLELGDFEALATELLTLVSGPDWEQPSTSYLSQHERINGTEHYPRAQDLGLWLGSLRRALEQQKLDDAAAAAWLRSLASSIDTLSQTNTVQADRRSLVDSLTNEVRGGHLTIHAALELVAYSDLTASSVTTVIGQAIRTTQRRLP